MRTVSLAILFTLLLVIQAFAHDDVSTESEKNVADKRNTDKRRTRRTLSDQRLAELEALINLATSPAPFGHGLVDPSRFGKRNRGSVMDELDEFMQE